MSNSDKQESSISKALNVQKEFNVQFSIKEILFKYLTYLPFILLLLSLSIGIGYVYVRYKEPVYKASIQILVKFEDTRTSSSGQDPNDLIQRALRESKILNLDNEITKLRSVSLLKKVVERGRFNYRIKNIGRFKSTTLFYDSPIEFEILKVPDSSAQMSIQFERFTRNAAIVDKKSKSLGAESITYGKPVNIEGFLLIVKKKNDFLEFNEPIQFTYEPAASKARNIISAMAVNAVGRTSALQIDLRDDNPVRAKEILNKLVEVFKEQDVETKRIASVNTIGFINERMEQVTNELDTTEAEILALKGTTVFNDVEQATIYYKSKLAGYETKIEDATIQRELINMLEEYIRNPKNLTRVVPVDLGIDNTFLITAMRQYNDLQLSYERDRKQLLDNGNNKILQDYKTRIDDIRYNILEILRNIKNENERKLNEANRRIVDSKDNLYRLPDIDRKIKIKQTQANIKKELYLYLLKRKEEVGITSATFVSSYDAIDAANASSFPVEPRVDNIRNFSILIGLIIPILIIYLIDLFNDKVTLREQIQKKLDIPIAGEVSHVANPGKFVFNQSRSLVAEQFRILRTNLTFLFRGSPQNQIILITSTISGEGKSFVSSNLAAALSVSDKKVALLLFDLRKVNSTPVITELLNGQHGRGLTNYLIGQVSDIDSILINTNEYPNLDIFPTGPMPPNPAELLLSHNVVTLFDTLKQRYDYIIIDSAPAGMVSDAFILKDYADLTLYIIRQRYTLIKQMEFISEIKDTEKLINMSIVVNDVSMGGRYGYYGYNYGYGYGYSYQYGYGYKSNPNGGYYLSDSSQIQLPWWAHIIRWFGRIKK